MGTWPINVVETFNPPAPFIQAQETFKKYYLSKSSRRVLKWAYTMSHVQLYAKFNRRKIIDANTYQASILLMFNEENTITIGILLQKKYLPN